MNLEWFLIGSVASGKGVAPLVVNCAALTCLRPAQNKTTKLAPSATSPFLGALPLLAVHKRIERQLF